MAQISIEWRDKVAQIPASLWDACYRPPFEGRWWYDTLENSGLDQQFRFMYGVVTRGATPVAIVPAFYMDVPMELVAPPWITPYLQALGKFFPRVLFQPTLFIGSPCSDEGTVGLVYGVELSEIAAAVHDAVEHKAAAIGAQMIAWKDFPVETDEALSKLCHTHGLFPSLSYPGTVVKLKGRTINDYLNQLKGTRRHNLKKKLKRSKETSKLLTSVVQYPDEYLLGEVWELFWHTYEKGETKFEKLTPAFFALIASKNVSYFVLLRDEESGKLVAFMLCFKIGHRVINKFIGFDYTQPSEWFLYFRLWEAALEWVLSTDATEFQSGQTGYRGKIDVGHELVPLINYCRNRNPLFHEVYRRVGPTITWTDLDRDLATFVKAHPEDEYKLNWADQSRIPVHA